MELHMKSWFMLLTIFSQMRKISQKYFLRQSEKNMFIAWSDLKSLKFKANNFKLKSFMVLSVLFLFVHFSKTFIELYNVNTFLFRGNKVLNHQLLQRHTWISSNIEINQNQNRIKLDEKCFWKSEFRKSKHWEFSNQYHDVNQSEHFKIVNLITRFLQIDGKIKFANFT